MPHLVLSYSSNLKEKDELQPLFLKLHHILVHLIDATLENCKSRAIEHKTYLVGAGEHENAFAHLEIRLRQGLELNIREQIGQQMLDVLVGYFSQSKRDLNLQITVECKEFPNNLYFKFHHKV